MSNNHAPYINKIDFVVIPSYKEKSFFGNFYVFFQECGFDFVIYLP